MQALYDRTVQKTKERFRKELVTLFVFRTQKKGLVVPMGRNSKSALPPSPFYFIFLATESAEMTLAGAYRQDGAVAARGGAEALGHIVCRARNCRICSFRIFLEKKYV
jgi:hypothetical protein